MTEITKTTVYEQHAYTVYRKLNPILTVTILSTHMLYQKFVTEIVVCFIAVSEVFRLVEYNNPRITKPRLLIVPSYIYVNQLYLFTFYSSKWLKKCVFISLN